MYVCIVFVISGSGTPDYDPRPTPPPPRISISIAEPTIQIIQSGSTVRFRCSGRSLESGVSVFPFLSVFLVFWCYGAVIWPCKFGTPPKIFNLSETYTILNNMPLNTLKNKRKS